MDPARKPHDNPRLLTSSLVFFVLATAVAAYLVWATTGERSRLSGCAPGSGCDDVLGSRWSLWLGQPVSLLGLGLYTLLALALALVRSARVNSAAWVPWLVTVAWSTGILILWFILLQAVVIKSFCVYCLGGHALALLAIACLLLYVKQLSARAGFAKVAIAAGLAGAFIATHIFVAPHRMNVARIDAVAPTPRPATTPAQVSAPAIEPRAQSRMVSLVNNQVSFDIYGVPCIGSPEAEFVIIELFDYTCSHCRDLHQHLHNALERYGEQLAIVTLPVPFNTACNPEIHRDHPVHANACVLAKYSLAVRAFDRERFPAFHDFLMSGKEPPNPELARTRAAALIGAEHFQQALTNPLVPQWLNDAIGLYKLANKGGVPKLIVGKEAVDVPYTTSDRLFAYLEKKLGIRPLTSQK
jgi:uncharacterized membrane protein